VKTGLSRVVDSVLNGPVRPLRRKDWTWTTTCSPVRVADLDWPVQRRARPGRPAGDPTACRRPRRLNCILISYVIFLYTKRPQPSTICLIALDRWWSKVGEVWSPPLQSSRVCLAIRPECISALGMDPEREPQCTLDNDPSLHSILKTSTDCASLRAISLPIQRIPPRPPNRKGSLPGEIQNQVI
jgi:hypothetical protein